VNFILNFTPTSEESLKKLKDCASLRKKYRAVQKTLNLLSENPRHPSLQTHQYYSISGPKGEKIFKAYAEQSTPSVYRVFFFYGPGKREITIFAITPHP